MGEIRPKRCEGRELTKDQLGAPPAPLSSSLACLPLTANGWRVLCVSRLGLNSETGPMTEGMVELDRPFLDFKAMAEGHGAMASRATNEAELAEQLTAAFEHTDGPWVIEAVFDRGSSRL